MTAHTPSQPPLANNSSIITIGKFDGFHKGHQALIKAMRSLKSSSNQPLIAITFKNHPQEVLKNLPAPPSILSLEHKKQLLHQAGIDEIIEIHFTSELANKTAQQFLEELYAKVPFEYLVLGQDAHFGKNRHADIQEIERIVNHLGAKCHFLPLEKDHDKRISSTAIRLMIEKGSLEDLKKLLGRPYSVLVQRESGFGIGKELGSPTLNFSVDQLLLPPLGVYAVKVRHQSEVVKAVANLGFAPSFAFRKKPVLEVHLLEPKPAFLQANFLEIIFIAYLRPEIAFPSKDALKEAIRHDIDTAWKIFDINASHSPF